MKNLNKEAGFDKLSLTTKATVMLNLFQHPFLKKEILICIRMTAVLLFVSSGLFAQTPHAINYQGVARDNAGKVMATKTVSLRLLPWLVSHQPLYPTILFR